ncbi:hypothetical protein Droror1_Dr00006571 [Drosera rotundifolia]
MENRLKPTKEEGEDGPAAAAAEAGDGGGGWGGWGLSSWSYISDLQKAAQEISRNAAAVAKSIAVDVQTMPGDPKSYEEEENVEESINKKVDEDEKDMLRKSALEKLEQAGEDSLLSQGLKVLDNSVETFASSAWQVLGNAFKEGSNLVQKLEHSAVNFAESIQHGGAAGSVAPSLLEAGKAFTTKGIQVLENVGKETTELLISETGMKIESNFHEIDSQAGDPLYEEMTFDRCFYIYGGPELLEELEALSNHYALLFNRKKKKLVAEVRSFHETRLKKVQQILDLNSDVDPITESGKGKQIETKAEVSDSELKILHDSGVNKAADMAAGFSSALTGLVVNDIIQRTANRLESLHSEGVHRLTEICCVAVSQLLMLGKSIISNANKHQEEDSSGDFLNISWPVDSLEKAWIVRTRAQSMTVSVEAVSNSFITGIADVAEAYLAAIKGMAVESHEAPLQKSIQDKVAALSEHLRTDGKRVAVKIQDGVQYLSFVVLSTSMSGP